MEYGIKATFTEEEYRTILIALKKTYENADEQEANAIAAGSIENEDYWFNKAKIARSAYKKVIYNQEEMPW